MTDFFGKAADLGYKKVKKTAKGVAGAVSDAVDAGIEAGSHPIRTGGNAAEWVIDNPREALTTPARVAHDVSTYGTDKIYDTAESAIQAVTGKDIAIPEFIRDPTGYVSSIPSKMLGNMYDVAKDPVREIVTDPMDAIKGTPGQFEDLAKGVASQGPIAKDWMQQVQAQVGDFKEDPSLMGIVRVAGSILGGIGIPLDTMKENTGDALYHQATQGQRDEFATVLDFVWNAVPGPIAHNASPTEYLEDHPELAKGVKDAYERGYNGHTGGRAAWEYVVGFMDTHDRAIADILYDPTTYLVGAGAAGKLIKGGRTAEELSLARKAAALPFEVLGGVDTAQNKVIEAPFKLLGKADALVGSPVARGSGKLANWTLDGPLGKAYNWATRESMNSVKARQQETIEQTILHWLLADKEVSQDARYKIQRAFERNHGSIDAAKASRKELQEWLAGPFSQWYREAVNAMDAGLPPPPHPTIPEFAGFNIDADSLNEISESLQRLPSDPRNRMVFEEHPQYQDMKAQLQRIQQQMSFQTQFDTLRNGPQTPSQARAAAAAPTPNGTVVPEVQPRRYQRPPAQGPYRPGRNDGTAIDSNGNSWAPVMSNDQIQARLMSIEQAIAQGDKAPRYIRQLKAEQLHLQGEMSFRTGRDLFGPPGRNGVVPAAAAAPAPPRPNGVASAPQPNGNRVFPASANQRRPAVAQPIPRKENGTVDWEAMGYSVDRYGTAHQTRANFDRMTIEQMRLLQQEFTPGSPNWNNMRTSIGFRESGYYPEPTGPVRFSDRGRERPRTLLEETRDARGAAPAPSRTVSDVQRERRVGYNEAQRILEAESAAPTPAAAAPEPEPTWVEDEVSAIEDAEVPEGVTNPSPELAPDAEAALEAPPTQPTATVHNIRKEPMDPDGVYIGREGQGQDGYFGNPFKLGQGESRGSTLEKFEKYARDRIARDPEYARRVKQLHGKKLYCFCAPEACHGDVLAKLAAEMNGAAPAPGAVVPSVVPEAASAVVKTGKAREYELAVDALEKLRQEARDFKAANPGQPVPQTLVDRGNHMKARVAELAREGHGTLGSQLSRPPEDISQIKGGIHDRAEIERQAKLRKAEWERDKFPEYSTLELTRKKNGGGISPRMKAEMQTELDRRRDAGIPGAEHQYQHMFNTESIRTNPKFQERRLELAKKLGYGENDLIPAGTVGSQIDETTGRNFSARRGPVDDFNNTYEPWDARDNRARGADRAYDDMGETTDTSLMDLARGEGTAVPDTYAGGRKRLAIETKLEPGEFQWNAKSRASAEQYFQKLKKGGKSQAKVINVGPAEKADIEMLAGMHPEANTLEDAVALHLGGEQASVMEPSEIREVVSDAAPSGPLSADDVQPGDILTTSSGLKFRVMEVGPEQVHIDVLEDSLMGSLPGERDIPRRYLDHVVSTGTFERGAAPTMEPAEIAQVVREATNPPPPPKAGYTRLYRGTSRGEIAARSVNQSTPFADLPWVQKARRLKGADQSAGRWFGQNPNEIGAYIDPAQHGSDADNIVTYIDVWTEDLDRYRVRNIEPGKEAVDVGADRPMFVDINPRKYSARHDTEFFLPRELADSSQEFPTEHWPPWMGPDPSEIGANAPGYRGDEPLQGPRLGPRRDEFRSSTPLGPETPTEKRFRLADIYDDLTEPQKRSVEAYYNKVLKAVQEGTKMPSKARVLPGRFHHNFLDDIEIMASNAVLDGEKMTKGKLGEWLRSGPKWLAEQDAKRAAHDARQSELDNFYTQADELAKGKGFVNTDEVEAMLPIDPETGEKIRPNWFWLNRRAMHPAPRFTASSEAADLLRLDEIMASIPYYKRNQTFMKAEIKVAEDDYQGWSIEPAMNHATAVSELARAFPEQWPIIQSRVRPIAHEIEAIYASLKPADKAIADGQLAEAVIEEAGNLGIDARFYWTKREGNNLTGVNYRPGSPAALVERLIHAENLADMETEIQQLITTGHIMDLRIPPRTQAHLDAQERFAEIVRLNKKMNQVPRMGRTASIRPLNQPYIRLSRAPDPKNPERSLWSVIDEKGEVLKGEDGKELTFRKKTEAMRTAYAVDDEAERLAREETIARSEGLPLPEQRGGLARFAAAPDSPTINEITWKYAHPEPVGVDPIEMRNANHIAAGEPQETVVDLDKYVDGLVDEDVNVATIRRLLGKTTDTEGMSPAQVLARDPAYGPHALIEHMYKKGSLETEDAVAFYRYVPGFELDGQKATVAELMQWADQRAQGDMSEFRRLVFGIMGKNSEAKQTSRLIKYWDTYMNVVRESMLMNFSRGLAALFTDMTSNVYTQVISGDLKAAQMTANPNEVWRNARFAMDHGGDEHVVAGWSRAQYGIDPPANLLQMVNRDQASQAWSGDTTIVKVIDSVGKKLGIANDAVPMKVARGASTAFASKWIKTLRGVQDQNARIANWWYHMQELDPAAKEEFFDLLGRRGANLGKTADEIDQWRNALGSHFTSADVKRVTGDTSLAQSWAGSIKKMSKQAEEEMHKVLFSYQMTNLDDQMRHVFLFHYWQTRAIAWHANMTIRNPYLLSLYAKAWEGTNRDMERAGLDDTGKFYWSAIASGSFRAILDPMAVLVPFAMLREFDGNGPESNFDKMMRQSNFFLNPLLSAAATAVGLSDRGVDISGTSASRNMIRGLVDSARAQGILPQGITGDPIQRIQDAVLRTANEYMGVFGSDMKDIDWAKTGAHNSIMEMIMSDGEKEFGPWTEMSWQERQEILGAQNALLMEDYSNPRLLNAMRKYQKVTAGEKMIRSVMPGNPDIQYQPDEKRDYLAKQGYNNEPGSKDDPAIQNAIASSQQINAGSEASATVTASHDFYQNLGTPQEQEAYGLYNQITYGNMPPGTTVEINGHTVTAEDVNAMDPEDREFLANKWQDQDPELAGDIASIKDRRRKFRGESPEEDAFIRYQAAVSDGDPARIRAELRQQYPEFAAREKRYRDKQIGKGFSGEALEQEMMDWLRSIDAYTAITGDQNKLRDPNVVGGNNAYPVIPGGGDYLFGPQANGAQSGQERGPGWFNAIKYGQGSGASDQYGGSSYPYGGDGGSQQLPISQGGSYGRMAHAAANYSEYSPDVPGASGSQNSEAKALSKQISAYLNGFGEVTPAVQRYLNWAERLRAMGYQGDTSVDAYLKAHADVSSMMAS